MKDTVRVILALLIAAGCGVCAAMAPKDDDKSPAAKLVDEKVIFKFTGDKDTAPGRDPGSMKLSPDGKRLLYIRRKRLEVGKGSPTRAYEVRLRTLAGGEEVVLPIPAYTWDDIPRMMISMNVFDAAGKRIVLGIGVDKNNDGLHKHREEKLQPAFYDIAKDKVTKLDVTDEIVLPTFDRTGKGLIIIAATEKARTGKMYTTPADKIKLKECGTWGLPRSTCPTADVIPLLLPPKRDADGRRGKWEFVLYDLANDKIAAKLPMDERNTMLDDYNPQWTADGRYLYYVDVKMAEAGGRRVTFTRIWDRKEGKLAGEIEKAVAIGPGPTKTTMVLSRRRMSSLMIHDAASGKTWQLASGQPIRPASVTSKYILYVKFNGEERTLCRARIALPK
ncbi:MAG: hypothetical protein ISS78_05315 [Phycisphaerae bacterium]|nr:hypothetical protein [Phycisphaerae bacterium]